MLLKDFHSRILPAAKALVADPTNLESVKEKAKAMVGDQPVVGEDGQPIDFASITLVPNAGDGATDEPGATDTNPAKSLTSEAIDARIEAAVNKAVADVVKATKPATKAPQNVTAVVKGEFSIPAEVRKHTPKNFHGVIGGKKADERAYRFGQWALATISKQLPGRFNFPAATKFMEDHFGTKTVHQENVNTASGYLVPEEFGTDIIVLREQYGVVRNVFKIVPMSSDTRSDPRRVSGLTASFVAEAGAGTESQKGWDQVRLTAKDLMVLSGYTAQLSADAVINIGDDLAGEISYAFANKEDDCGFNGTGAATYGGIVGVRIALANVSSNAGVYTPAATAWSSLVLADFHSTIGLLPQYADTPNACWVCHRAFYYGVMQKLELASGGVPAREVMEGDRRPRPMFLGYPVQISQVMPSSTATATIPVTLGDHSMAASFGDRAQDSIAFSEHATIGGENVFERNEIAIRGIERFDINVHDVGSSTAAGPVVGLSTHS